MKTFPNATNSLSHSLFTFGRVCRLMLALVCLAMVNVRQEIIAEELSIDTEVSDPNSLVTEVYLMNHTLTLNIPENETAVTNRTCIIYGPGTVVKTGEGTLTIGSLFRLQQVDNFIVDQGTYIINNEGCYSKNTLIRSGATLVITGNGIGGSSLGNLTGEGNLETSSTDAVGGRLLNTSDTTFSGILSGSGKLRLLGDHNLTLSGANTFRGDILLSSDYDHVSYPSLTLKDDAIVDYGQITFLNTVLDYNVSSDVTKSLTISDVLRINGIAASNGKLVKSGKGELELYAAADYAVRAESWVVSSGKLDYQGYFRSLHIDGTPTGLIVEAGATLSPGKSNSTGSIIANQSNVTINEAGILLFEFDQFREGTFDTITIGGGNKFNFTLEDGAIVQLAFLRNDAESWAKENAEYQLVKDDHFAENQDDDIIDYSSHLRGTGSNLFLLEGRKNQGLFLVYNPEPTPVVESVPEPSTWALLTLGVAGLIYWRKRKN